MALNSRCKGCHCALGPEDNDGANTQPERCTRCRKAHEAKNHPLAIKGRQLKALAMAEVIDKNALAQKPPINPFDQAGRILLASLEWADEVWETIGERARKPDGSTYERKPISPETREALRSIYRGRSAAPGERREAS